ncbi:MAG: acyl-CoA dehydrogenase [Alphaproteobacteria bacterium]|nr:acyl-CoA dehydrogenase [Alphaproteobacteria bacterium]
MPHFENNRFGRSNAFLSDTILFKIASGLPGNLLGSFEEVGEFVSNRDAQDLARLANQYRPKLYLSDEFGNIQSRIEIHPAYHALSRRSKHIGLVSSLWEEDSEENGLRYQARAIRLFLMAGLENGHLDEIIQTNAGIAALLNETELYQMLKPYLLNRQYDSADKEILKKNSISLALATKKDSGHNFAKMLSSDAGLVMNNYAVNANNCVVANPNADAFYIIAELGGARCCFLVPKYDMNGKANNIKINYLMDNAGYCSRPLAKVSFANSVGWMIGQVGEGNKIADTIDIMLQFDQTVIAISSMWSALQFTIETLSHKNEGSTLSALTTRIFADIALDIAAAQSLVFRLARAFDNSVSDKAEAAFARILTPIVAYWANVLTMPILGELIAHLGIEAYNETAFLPRFLKDAPVRSLSSKNLNELVLDVLNSAHKAPNLMQNIFQQIAPSSSSLGEKTHEVLNAAMRLALSDEAAGRFFIEQIAYAASCSALEQLGEPQIIAAFSESRLGGGWRSSYGTLNMRHNAEQILQILYPAF